MNPATISLRRTMEQKQAEYDRGESRMAEEIAANLYRIEVPLPKNPLKSINSYVIKDAERSLVIDTGMNREECKIALQSGFSEIGIDLAKTDFLLTHMHADHSALAATFILPGRKVYASRQAAIIINTFSGPDIDTHWDELRDYAVLQGFPQEILSLAIEKHPGHMYRPERRLDFTFLTDGEVLSAAGYHFHCIFTPGHTQGHVCLYEPNSKILISGDHILGDITPNISQWIEDEDALDLYFSSLDKVARLDVAMVLPGHRRLFTDCQGRINELKEHHSRRLNEVMRIIQDKGPLNAYEIARWMTWDMRGTWENFPIPQKWFAHGEAIAHIKYLQKKGWVVCLETDNSPVRYSAS